MTYVAAEARQELLDQIASAIDRIAVGLADVGEAYELVDETTGDRLEAEVFRPLQLAYGLAKRVHGGFADRHGLPAGTFALAPEPLASRGVKGLLESAVDAVGEADRAIAALQDSMVTVEIGDAELRAGLSEVRRAIGELPGRVRLFVRTLGR